MKDENMDIYKPVGRGALVSHLLLITVFFGASIGLFILALQVELGLAFILYLLGSLFLAVPVPIFVRRLRSYLGARYFVSREGIQLVWGGRKESLPIDQIEWVRLAEDLTHALTPPRLRWPGAVLGSSHHVDAGRVEFLASSTQNLVIIGSSKKVFAISPDSAEAFIAAFHQKTLLGSISPMTASSEQPRFLFSEVWTSMFAKIFLVTSVVLSVGLFILAAAITNVQSEILLGFSAQGFSLGPIPSVQLFLIPVMNVFLQLSAFLLASYFHKMNTRHPFTFVLWGSSTVMSLLFFAAVLLSTRATAL